MIYRVNQNRLRIWAQITDKKMDECFKNENFYGYYNQIPTEQFILYVEIIEIDLTYSDYVNLEIYYLIIFWNQSFTSRKFYSISNLKLYDEYKFKAQNLKQKLNIKIYYNLEEKYIIDIDLTSHELGKVVQNDYKIGSSYRKAKIKWQVTEPCQSRWEERILKLNSINLHLGKYQLSKSVYEFWKISFW